MIKMLNKIASIVLVSLVSFSNISSGVVKAEEVCQVTDPTGTPLNVRDAPNGRIINALKNGREVYIQEIDYDQQGRPWALVGGYYQGKYRVWGWVIREFISCYER